MKRNKISVAISLLLSVIILFTNTASTAFATGSCDEAKQVSGDVTVSGRFWELFFGKREDEKTTGTVLIPSGTVFGARIVQSFPSVVQSNTPSVKVGDIILEVDGCKLKTVEEIKDHVAVSKNSSVRLLLGRGQNKISCTVTPTLEDGEYRLGIALKDTSAGIGTITYIDPETGCFGGLGHGITDKDSGLLVDASGGEVTGVILGGIQKGESGKPGELTGILTDRVYGEIYANTSVGIFGKLEQIPQGYIEVGIGQKEDVHNGEAEIISTVRNGKTARYKVQIYEIKRDENGTKCFKIKVTDPTLLAITGGIVKGMSGSPIIQDGKLIGAVTHVMIADPTEGYGIFIENMLSASGAEVLPKAA